MMNTQQGKKYKKQYAPNSNGIATVEYQEIYATMYRW